MAARRRAGSLSPNTSLRLRVNKVDTLMGMTCLLSTAASSVDANTSTTSPWTTPNLDILFSLRVPRSDQPAGLLEFQPRTARMQARGIAVTKVAQEVRAQPAGRF